MNWWSWSYFPNFIWQQKDIENLNARCTEHPIEWMIRFSNSEKESLDRRDTSLLGTIRQITFELLKISNKMWAVARFTLAKCSKLQFLYFSKQPTSPNIHKKRPVRRNRFHSIQLKQKKLRGSISLARKHTI